MKKVSGPQVVTTPEALRVRCLRRFRKRSVSSSGQRGRVCRAQRRSRAGVVHELMEREVDEVVGPKGKHNRDRTANRHGHEDGHDARWAACAGPPAADATADDETSCLFPVRVFADRDPLTRAVMDRMLAGVSTRKFVIVGEPVGEEVEQDATSTGKSTVSELFIERTRRAW